jgi:ribosomal protein S18 acetylase RimI-like enzyme
MPRIVEEARVTRPPVEVRKAVADDLDDLLLLWSQAREDLGRSGRTLTSPAAEAMRPRLLETLCGSETYVLLARWEGRPTGYAVLRLAPVLAILDGHALHIDHLFVLPEARRRGIARALLVAATAIAERHGAEQILAGAAPSAKDTQRFLARLGFAPLVVRRAVATSALRRRLAGEGQRRGLEDLLSRRRSLRARAMRMGWSGGSGGASGDEPAAEALAGRADDTAPDLMAVTDEPASPDAVVRPDVEVRRDVEVPVHPARAEDVVPGERPIPAANDVPGEPGSPAGSDGEKAPSRRRRRALSCAMSASDHPVEAAHDRAAGAPGDRTAAEPPVGEHPPAADRAPRVDVQGDLTVHLPVDGCTGTSGDSVSGASGAVDLPVPAAMAIAGAAGSAAGARRPGRTARRRVP